MSSLEGAKSSLCWKCAKSTNSGCSWSMAFVPVEGWTAVRDIIHHNYRSESYMVVECPEFERDSQTTCEDCRFFEVNHGSMMFGHCTKFDKSTNIRNVCGDWRRIDV